MCDLPPRQSSCATRGPPRHWSNHGPTSRAPLPTPPHADTRSQPVRDERTSRVPYLQHAARARGRPRRCFKRTSRPSSLASGWVSCVSAWVVIRVFVCISLCSRLCLRPCLCLCLCLCQCLRLRARARARVRRACEPVTPRHVAESCRRQARLNRRPAMTKNQKPESPPGIAAQSSSRKPPLVGYSLFFMATLNPGNGWAMAAYLHASSPTLEGSVLARPIPQRWKAELWRGPVWEVVYWRDGRRQ